MPPAGVRVCQPGLLTQPRDLSLQGTVEQLNALGTSFIYEVAPALSVSAGPDCIVLPDADLDDHKSAPHARVLALMAERGFGERKRLISASLALRLGWASGFEIGSYLLTGALARIETASIVLERGLLRKVVLHRAALEAADHLPPEERHAIMAERLYERALPFVRTHNEWSRLSMRALFSMLESSWAGQFVTIGDATGQGEKAALEAEAILGAHPVLRQDAPALYPVEAGGRRKTCQRRTLCCLYYRMPQAGYCGSCPILPEHERTSRQRQYVSEYGMPMH